MDHFIQPSDPTPSVEGERRRNPRKSLRQRVTIGTAAHGILQGHTVDFSVGGLSVFLSVPLDVNTHCSVHFNLLICGSTVHMVGAGKVINCTCSGLDGFRVGMKFMLQDAKLQQLLEKFISK